MSRVRIDIEEIMALQQRRKEINALELDTIDFYKNGEKVAVAPEDVEEWKYIGLSNIHFAQQFLEIDSGS